MLHRLILKVTKFHLPPPKHLSTVVKTFLGGHHDLPPYQIGLMVDFLNLKYCIVAKILYNRSRFSKPLLRGTIFQITKFQVNWKAVTNFDCICHHGRACLLLCMTTSEYVYCFVRIPCDTTTNQLKKNLN